MPFECGQLTLPMSDDKKKNFSSQEALSRLEELLARRACELVLEGDQRIKAVKPGKNSKSKQDYATIEQIDTFVRKHGLVLDEEGSLKDRRIYRKRENLPDPDKSHRSEVNRIKKQFRIRVEPDLQERVDAAAAAEGMTRQDWVTRVLEQALDEPD